MSLTLVYVGAAAGLAPAASLRTLAGGGAVFVPAGLDGALRALVAEAADPSAANWAKVAKKYSIDPTTKDKGGSLGSRPPEAYNNPPFAKALNSLKAGKISQPVKTSFGWHIVEVLKKTPGSSKTFEEAKPMIEQSLKFQLQAKAWETWLADAQKQANILYASGFDPKTLTASPSPAPSPTS